MTEVPNQPPIGDYALVGDCHSAALVSRRGSIDWCCLPRFDSASVFGRLLDWERGGCWELGHDDAGATSRRCYLDDTLVLATTFETRDGTATVYDAFSMVEGGAESPRRQLLRVIEGDSGAVAFTARLTIRFDYADVRPWLRAHSDGAFRVFSAVDGDDALIVTTDAPLEPVDGHDLRARFTVREGERVRFSATWVRPEQIDPDPPTPTPPDEIDRRLDEAIGWWRHWVGRMDLAVDPAVRRSAIVLKALTYAPTGAVVAAVTTSLPEDPGGVRNWDYRYSWISDAQFTVRSLGEVGCDGEADRLRRFVERSSAGDAESLQIAYGVTGQRRLDEIELSDLAGYRGSTPIRVGNAAARQVQLDVYGYLLDLAWQWHRRGRSPDGDYWRFLVTLADAAATRWEEPDRGIWELRGDPRHFVPSKVMCWAALDRALRLADACGRADQVDQLDRWTKARDAIRQEVEGRGYDRDRGVFVQSFDADEVDSALLLLPAYDFVAYDDPRMVRTTDAVRADLDDHGLLRRYRNDDGIPGREGAFIACTFWLVEALVGQRRRADAEQAFAPATATANDVGLLAEESEPGTGALLGSLPQGLSHLSHLTAAIALGSDRQSGPAPRTEDEPIGEGRT